MGNAVSLTAKEVTAIGRRVKTLRKRLLLSQAEFGDLMGVSGVTICNLETEKFGGASAKTLRKLARIERQVKETGDVSGISMRLPR